MKPFLAERLYNALLVELSSGHYAENQRFLSLREICERFDVSKPTVNRVQRRLLEEGLLYARPRSGSFLKAGARQRAMLLLENASFSTIPTPRTWRTSKQRLLAASSGNRRCAIALLYHGSSAGMTVGPERLGEGAPLPLLRGIQGCLNAGREREVEVTLLVHNGTQQRQDEVRQHLATHPFSGLLLMQRSRVFRHFHEIADPFLSAGLPVANAFGEREGADVISVDFNNVAGGFQAARHLIEAGCRRLTVVTLTASMNSSILRLEGAQLAAQAHGVPVRSVEAFWNGQELSLPPSWGDDFEREGVIGSSFDLTQHAYRQALARGRCIGRDFGCVGFSSVATMEDGVEMDIMKMDFDAVGAAALHALVDEIQGKAVHRALLIPLNYTAGQTMLTG